jgi:hypothetical protein
MLAYLCGPIEFAADGGKMWRRKLTPFLHNELGHRVYDPAEDQKKSLTDEEAAHFREWKQTDTERFRRVVRKIIQYDLDIIENKADYVICYLTGHSRVPDDGCRRRASRRMDAGMRRPRLFQCRRIEEVPARPLWQGKTGAALAGVSFLKPQLNTDKH